MIQKTPKSSTNQGFSLIGTFLNYHSDNSALLFSASPDVVALEAIGLDAPNPATLKVTFGNSLLKYEAVAFARFSESF